MKNCNECTHHKYCERYCKKYFKVNFITAENCQFFKELKNCNHCKKKEECERFNAHWITKVVELQQHREELNEITAASCPEYEEEVSKKEKTTKAKEEKTS